MAIKFQYLPDTDDKNIGPSTVPYRIPLAINFLTVFAGPICIIWSLLDKILSNPKPNSLFQCIPASTAFANSGKMGKWLPIDSSGRGFLFVLFIYNNAFTESYIANITNNININTLSIYVNCIIPFHFKINLKSSNKL